MIFDAKILADTLARDDFRFRIILRTQPQLAHRVIRAALEEISQKAAIAFCDPTAPDYSPEVDGDYRCKVRELVYERIDPKGSIILPIILSIVIKIVIEYLIERILEDWWQYGA